MKLKQEIDINLLYLTNTLEGLLFCEYPNDVKRKLISLINYIDSKNYIRIPDNYDIISEKFELTYNLKKNGDL